MKFEYHAGDPEQCKGLLTYLTASSLEEQRWLTTVFELCHSGKIRVRPVGAERIDRTIPGLPDRPCTRVSFTMELWDGYKWVPYIPQKEEVLDPNKFVRVESQPGKVVNKARIENMRITHHTPGRFVVEE